MKKIFLPIFFFSSCTYLHAQDVAVFPPPTIQQSIYANKAIGNITLDGKLTESDWQTAISITNFKQVEPFQGEASKYPTIVKILFDNKYLYVGAFCKDSIGRKGIRVQDFRRDFDYFSNDLRAFQGQQGFGPVHAAPRRTGRSSHSATRARWS